MEYPKMIYHADGRTHVLPFANAPRPEGEWSDTPSDVHYRAPEHFAIMIDSDPLPYVPSSQAPQRRGPGRPRKMEGEDNG